MTRTSRDTRVPGPLPLPGDSPLPEPRLPLASPEAEKAVLGALLLNPALLPAVTRFLPDALMFFHLETRQVYDALLRLDATGVTADHVTIPEEVCDLYGVDPGVTRALLADLLDLITPDTSVDFHAALVRELADRRESYRIVRGALEAVALRGTPFRDLVAVAVSRLAERIRPPADDAPLLRTLLSAMDDIDALWVRNQAVTGLPTGLGALDLLTHGLQPEHLVVVAGRPAGGKTQFLLHLTRQAALVQAPGGAPAPWPTLLDSLEMTRTQLVKRLLKAEAGIDWWDPRAAVGAGARPYLDACQVISTWPLEIEEECYSVPQLRLRLELFRKRYPTGPALVGVDYLSHLRLDYGQGGERRDAMIGEQITRPLKRLARDFGVCVVLLAQINRAGAREPRSKADAEKPLAPLPRPRLTDLKDSGDIEQDADLVIFLHPLGPGGTHRYDGNMDVGLEKNRHGQSGWMEAHFDGPLGRYSERPTWQGGGAPLPAGRP